MPYYSISFPFIHHILYFISTYQFLIYQQFNPKSPTNKSFLCSHLFYKIDSQKQNTIQTLNINVDVDMIDDDNTFICL